MGAVPILVIPPRTRAVYFVPSAENARRACVINLCDPVKYPELYALKYRVDTSHLNAAGTLDGQPYTGKIFLAAGPHEFASAKPQWPHLLVWAQALECGYRPDFSSEPVAVENKTD